MKYSLIFKILLFYIFFSLASSISFLYAQCQIQYKNSMNDIFLSNTKWKYSFTKSQRTATQIYKNDEYWKSTYLAKNWKKLPKAKKKDSIWYRCFLYIKEDLPRNKALFLGEIENNDEVYFNSVFIGDRSQSKKNSYNVLKQRLYTIPNELWAKGKNLISIRLEGSAIYSNGIKYLSLVDESTMVQRIITKDFPKIIVCFALWILAILIGLFYFSPKQEESLYLSIFSLLMGFHYLLQTWISHEIFSNASTAFFMERITLFLAPPFIFEYFQRITGITKKRFSYGIYTTSALLGALALFLPSKLLVWSYLSKINIFLLLIYTSSIIHIIYVTKKKQGNALKYILIGSSTVIIASISDILETTFFHSLPSLFPFALLIFIICAFLQITKFITASYQEMIESHKKTRLVEKRKTISIYNMSKKFDDSLDEVSNLIEKQISSKKNKFSEKENAIIKPAILSLENLIRDSEQLRNLDAKNYIPKYITFRLDTLCQEIIERACLTTKQKNSRVKLKIDKNISMIISDSSLLSLALYHILENALLYTQGKIIFDVETIEEKLQFQIIDEGPGIENSQREIVFQKFSRGEEFQDTINGLGIGLSLVALAVERLGAQLNFNNNHGFFSSVALTIPNE